MARCAVLAVKGGLVSVFGGAVARAGATRSVLVQGSFCFWCLRDAQLGLARRAALPCLVLIFFCARRA
ncbi:hypothetical protein A2U01_0084186, partial [Trifolium medium]|nr:hypothetical protein [Trifolium medium]